MRTISFVIRNQHQQIIPNEFLINIIPQLNKSYKILLYHRYNLNRKKPFTINYFSNHRKGIQITVRSFKLMVINSILVN